MKRSSYKCLLSDEEKQKIKKNQILLVIKLNQSKIKSVISDPHFFNEVKKNLVVEDPFENQKDETKIKSRFIRSSIQKNGFNLFKDFKIF